MQQNATVYEYKYNMKSEHAEKCQYLLCTFVFHVPSNGKLGIKNFNYNLFQTYLTFISSAQILSTLVFRYSTSPVKYKVCCH